VGHNLSTWFYHCINIKFKKYTYLYFTIYFIVINKCKLLFKNVSGGLRRCGIGGLIGFSLATAFSLIASRDKIKDMGKNVYHS